MRMKWLVPMLLFGCAQPPAPALEPHELLVWFTQRGLETRNLQISTRPSGQGAAGGLPERIQFSTKKPTGELEAWRLSLREDFGAWITSKGHPEGQCTSVDLKPEKDDVAVDIQIVCR